MHRFADLLFTPEVAAAQQWWGSRSATQRWQRGDAPDDRLGPDEVEYLESRDGFFLATVGSTGWPYVQFRGGPPGFVRVLDEHRLAWADVRGNRQYVSVGNLAGDDRVALIALDWPTRSRLKLLGHATVTAATDDPDLTARLDTGDGVVERVVVVHVSALAWNCPQHITPRFTAEEVRGVVDRAVDEAVEQAVAPLHRRIRDLERQLAASARPRPPRPARGGRGPG